MVIPTFILLMYGKNYKYFIFINLRNNSAVKLCNLMNSISSTIWVWKLIFVKQIVMENFT